MATSQHPEQFRHVINNLEISIDTAKSLRRAKSKYLDTGVKIEVDLAITTSEDVLQNIDRNIEGYRSDTHSKGLDHVKHHRDWLFRSHAPPVNNGPTPASCLRCLDTLIESMSVIRLPPPPISQNIKKPVPPTPLPGYRDSLAPLTQRLQAPSLRKLRSKRSMFGQTGAPTPMASTSTLSFVTEKEVDYPHNHTFDNDTSSSFSYDDRPLSSSCTGDSSVSSRTSYISTSCAENYSTLEYYSNNGGAGAPDGDDDGDDAATAAAAAAAPALPDVHSLSLDPRHSDKILTTSLSPTIDPWNNTSLRAPSRRRKGRSGYI